jgi:uncharacterized membrane protein YgaE (UPF0421/DUF939 family)
MKTQLFAWSKKSHVYPLRTAIAALLALLVARLAALRLDRPANRFAAIALAVVLLIPRPESAWIIALHRFIEVSAGILVGLLLSALWPEPTTKTN